VSEEYIVWFGSLATGNAPADATNAMSPAADRWQRELASAIARQGIAIEVVSFIARPAWPRGPLGLLESMPVSVAANVTVSQVAYRNVPWWRVGEITAKRVSAGLRRARGRLPRAIVCYNAHPNAALASVALRALTRVPWACLVADLQSPSPLTSRSPLAIAEWTALAAADARVYLSAALAPRFRRDGDLHMDGGIDVMQAYEPGEPGHVVYAGALTTGAGVDLAISSFRHVKHPDARLTVFGNGDANRVRSLAAGDARIDIKGMVPRDELARGLARARVLLNPRLPYLAENARNFPSKLLDYLAQGKPIVSTWTAGLSEGYRALLHTAEADSAPLAAAIDNCLGLSSADLLANYDRIKDFARQHTWDHQARRFLATLERIRLGPRAGWAKE